MYINIMLHLTNGQKDMQNKSKHKNTYRTKVTQHKSFHSMLEDFRNIYFKIFGKIIHFRGKWRGGSVSEGMAKTLLY